VGGGVGVAVRLGTGLELVLMKTPPTMMSAGFGFPSAFRPDPTLESPSTKV
jgi:hypothetical protein